MEQAWGFGREEEKKLSVFTEEQQRNLIIFFWNSLTAMTTITPRSRVISEKQTDPQLLKAFPALYGTRRFITSFTTARHMSLSWATSIQSMPPSHLSNIRFNIIPSSTPVSSKWEVRMYSIRVNEENAMRWRYCSPLPYASCINSSKFLQHKPTRLLLTYFMSRPATCREEHLLHRSLVSWDHLACKSLRSREGNAPAFQRYRLINMTQAKAIVFTTLAAY